MIWSVNDPLLHICIRMRDRQARFVKESWKVHIDFGNTISWRISSWCVVDMFKYTHVVFHWLRKSYSAAH